MNRSINYPMILFIIGLNFQFFYDTLVALELVVLQEVEYLAFLLLWSSAILSIARGDYALLRKRYLLIGSLIGLYFSALTLRAIFSDNINYAFSRDIFAYSYVSALFIGAKFENWKWLHRIFIAHFLIASTTSVVALFPFREKLYYEAIIWQSPYKTWNNMYAWQYALLISITSNHWLRPLITAGVTLYVIQAILFQKRTPNFVLLFTLAVLLFLLWQHKVLLQASQRSVLLVVTAIVAVPTLLLVMDSGSGEYIADATDHLWARYSTVDNLWRDGRFSDEITAITGADNDPIAEPTATPNDASSTPAVATATAISGNTVSGDPEVSAPGTPSAVATATVASGNTVSEDPAASATATPSDASASDSTGSTSPVSSVTEADPKSDEGSSTFDVLFGNGFGVEHAVPLNVSDTGFSGNFHNGVAGVVFKGGIILASLFTAWLLLVLWDLRRLRNRHAYVCLAVLGTAVLVSPVQSVLNTSPLWAIIFACIGYLASTELTQQKPVYETED